jgi:hypothetical protein
MNFFKSIFQKDKEARKNLLEFVVGIIVGVLVFLVGVGKGKAGMQRQTAYKGE